MLLVGFPRVSSHIGLRVGAGGVDGPSLVLRELQRRLHQVGGDTAAADRLGNTGVGNGHDRPRHRVVQLRAMSFHLSRKLMLVLIVINGAHGPLNALEDAAPAQAWLGGLAQSAWTS